MPMSSPIDYTNIGYDALKDAMLTLARERMPEWTDFTENDLGVLLVELLAHACDITLYYQTRVAQNLFPETTDEPDALVQLLRLIGYELRPPSPATANLRIAFDAAAAPPIVIPARTQFSVTLPTGGQVVYETERTVEILASQLTPPDVLSLRYYFPLPVVQGETVVGEVIGISDGSPNQMFPLLRKPVLTGSVQITVSEPGGDTRWDVVETLAYSTPADRHTILQRDAHGGATILFGDGSNGLIPVRGTSITPVQVRATYRVGSELVGNVSAGTRFRAALALIRDAVSPEPAAGWAPGEDGRRARLFAPRLYRTQDRAVTSTDYADLTLQVPGVGKSLAVATGWNDVVLFIAPTGQVAEPSELVKRDVLSFLENRRMITTGLRIVGPQAADIYIVARVLAKPFYLNADVQKAAEQAVAEYLAFDAVEFGQALYLSKVYDIIQSLPQVASLLVTRFSRSHRGEIDTDGTIVLGPNELPRPGYRDNSQNILFDPLRPDYRPPVVAVVEGGVGL